MTRFYRSIIVVSIALSVLFLYRHALAFDDGDWQYWNTEEVSFKVSDNCKAVVEEELRWGDDMSNPYYNHTDVGIVYSGLADWFDLGLNYRHINEEKGSGWKRESRPHINGTVKWKLRDFSFSNRGRIEYREKEDADDYWEYRNKFSIKPPMPFTRHKIQPYLTDEIFVDFDQGELYKNRLSPGFSFNAYKTLKCELYYLWQRSKSTFSGKWSDTNVLGTKIKVLF